MITGFEFEYRCAEFEYEIGAGGVAGGRSPLGGWCVRFN
jgi:hypothetical protein